MNLLPFFPLFAAAASEDLSPGAIVGFIIFVAVVGSLFGKKGKASGGSGNYSRPSRSTADDDREWTRRQEEIREAHARHQIDRRDAGY